MGRVLFDPNSGELRADERVQQLAPIPSRFLECLVRNAERVTPHDELLQSVWGDTAVGRGSITFVVSQLRQALRDLDADPSAIEVVRGRGYRWVGPAGAVEAGARRRLPGLARELIGRQLEIEELRAVWAQTCSGQRRIVLLRGESGVGKSSLLRAFLDGLSANTPIGLGQCLERYGVGEAFLAWIESLTDLVNGPHGERLAKDLRERAPIWWSRLGIEPTVPVSDAEMSSRFQILTLISAVESMTQHAPIVLLFEDLQWSDPSAIEAILALAQRPAPAPIMIVGTYRTDSATAEDDPTRVLLSQLISRAVTHDIVVSPLGVREVSRLVDEEFPSHDFPPGLAETLYRRSEGNPLFVVSLLAGLREDGLAERAGDRWVLRGNLQGLERRLSRNLVLLMRKQASRLSDTEYECLEAASVVGAMPDAALVAAACGRSVAEVDEVCASLVRRALFLRRQNAHEWPDGSRTSTYSFLHAAHQEVLYDGIAPVRRRRLHLRVAERLDEGFAGQRRRVYGLLAMHYARAGAVRRAATYHRRAGALATERAALTEAIHHYRAALRLLDEAPAEPEANAEKVLTWIGLGAALVGSLGHGASQVGEAFEEARRLCQGLQPSTANLFASHGLAVNRLVRGDYAAVCRLSRESVRQVGEMGLPAEMAPYIRLHEAQARMYMGQVERAARLAEALVELTDRADFLISAQRRSGLYWLNPRVSARVAWAATLSLQGRPDDARRVAEEIAALARHSGRPYEHAYALTAAVVASYLPQRDWASVGRLMAEASPLAERHGFTLVGSAVRILSELAKQRDADLRRLEETLEEYTQVNCDSVITVYLATMADIALLKGLTSAAAGYVDAGLAQARKVGERCFEPELLRLRGVLARESGDLAAAASWLEQSTQRSEQLGTTWWLLRTAIDTYLLRRRRAPREARQRLAAALARQQGGLGVDDVQRAQRLLAE